MYPLHVDPRPHAYPNPNLNPNPNPTRQNHSSSDELCSILCFLHGVSWPRGCFAWFWCDLDRYQYVSYWHEILVLCGICELWITLDVDYISQPSDVATIHRLCIFHFGWGLVLGLVKFDFGFGLGVLKIWAIFYCSTVWVTSLHSIVCEFVA